MRSSIRKGPTPYKGGCRFVVWAPHAEEMFVVGSFNNWDKNAHPMNREPGGFWSIDVPGANPADEYRYRIINAGKEYLRIDPYARRVTNSVGNAIITKPCRMSKGEGFKPPPLNEMVIYELTGTSIRI